MQYSFPPDWDAALRKYFAQGGCPVPTMAALVAYLVADETTLMLATPANRQIFIKWMRMDGHDMPDNQRFPESLAHTIHGSRDFKNAVQQASIEEVFAPEELRKVYESIKKDLVSDKTPLAAKTKTVDWLGNQQGWGRPKRLQVDQTVHTKGTIVVLHGPTMQLPPDEVVDAEYTNLGGERALPGATGIFAPGGFESDAEPLEVEPVSGDEFLSGDVE